MTRKLINSSYHRLYSPKTSLTQLGATTQNYHMPTLTLLKFHIPYFSLSGENIFIQVFTFLFSFLAHQLKYPYVCSIIWLLQIVCFLLLKIGVLILCPLMCINFIAIEIKGEEFIRVVVKRDLTIIFKN